MIDLLEDKLDLMEDKKVIEILNKIYNFNIEPIRSIIPNTAISISDSYDLEKIFIRQHKMDKDDKYLNNIPKNEFPDAEGRYRAGNGSMFTYDPYEIEELSKISSKKNSNEFINYIFNNRKKTSHLIKKLSDHLEKRIKESNMFKESIHNVFVSNNPIYNNSSPMGWHTNCDEVGYRWYFLWNSDDKSSFFRYRHQETGEIITKYEPRGWSINQFHLTDCNNPLWHVIYTNKYRVAIGLGINDREQKI